VSFLFDLLLQSFWPELVNILIALSLLVGITTYFADKIPFSYFSENAKVVRLLSMIIFVFAVYCKGYITSSNDWQQKIAEYEKQIALNEKLSEHKNIEIQEKIVEKVKVVKDTQYVIQEKLVEIEKIIDAECKIPPAAIDLHNAAAKNVKPNE
jgi:hypothetical protein